MRFFYSLDLAVSLVYQRANDFLRVMHIHLAAKGFQIKRFFLLSVHRSSITQQNSGVCGYSYRQSSVCRERVCYRMGQWTLTRKLAGTESIVNGYTVHSVQMRFWWLLTMNLFPADLPASRWIWPEAQDVTQFGWQSVAGM